jgi:hypothetical protein
VVHQETDGAQLHAEHRLAEAAVAMQGLQHEAVAAKATGQSAASARMAPCARPLRERALGFSAGLARKATGAARGQACGVMRRG